MLDLQMKPFFLGYDFVLVMSVYSLYWSNFEMLNEGWHIPARPHPLSLVRSRINLRTVIISKMT